LKNVHQEDAALKYGAPPGRIAQKSSRDSTSYVKAPENRLLRNIYLSDVALNYGAPPILEWRPTSPSPIAAASCSPKKNILKNQQILINLLYTEFPL